MQAAHRAAYICSLFAHPAAMIVHITLQLAFIRGLRKFNFQSIAETLFGVVHFSQPFRNFLQAPFLIGIKIVFLRKHTENHAVIGCYHIILHFRSKRLKRKYKINFFPLFRMGQINFAVNRQAKFFIHLGKCFKLTVDVLSFLIKSCLLYTSDAADD